jgi:phosphoribosyl 1,2-cyclic phosphodiesterase
VSWAGETVLIDAGFSARETLRRLEAAGGAPERVHAIVITHEHTDHIAGLRVLAKRLSITVYATAGTIAAASITSIAEDVRVLAPGEPVSIGAMGLTAFRTSHDAAEPIGLVVSAPDGTSFGLATDTGELTEEALEVLSGCTVLGIETNHDERTLLNGPYPWFLKQRILSARGHLSNDAAAGALRRLAHDGLREIVGVHISRTNNTPAMAAVSLERAVNELDLSTTITVARQDAAHAVDRPAGSGSGLADVKSL